MAIRPDSALSRLVQAARADKPLLRLTLPSRLARFLVAAGARPAPAADSMTMSYKQYYSFPEFPGSRPVRGSGPSRLVITHGYGAERYDPVFGGYQYPRPSMPDAFRVISIRSAVRSVREFLELVVQELNEHPFDPSIPSNAGSVISRALRRLSTIATALDSDPGNDFLQAVVVLNSARNMLFHSVDRQPNKLSDQIEKALKLLSVWAVHDTELDLTGLDLRHTVIELDDLDGATWSATTRWPTEQLQRSVRLESTEIADGVYKVSLSQEVPFAPYR